ncbi:MAG TPA: hypothetical protein VHW93_03430, partial [Acidimicrobiales bacterium]|nr:hypothetical protein [Acidimicrobiales bacterium]
MARFLSPSWVAEQNAALADAASSELGTGAGPPLADGPVTVIEEVAGGPDGDVRLVMTVDAGTIRLSLDGEDGPDGPDGEGGGGP